MELVQAQVTVSKEAYALGMALGKLAIAAKQSLADGFQAADLPNILSALMSADVASAVMGIGDLGGELKGNKSAFIAAFIVAAANIAEQLEAPSSPAA